MPFDARMQRFGYVLEEMSEPRSERVNLIVLAQASTLRDTASSISFLARWSTRRVCLAPAKERRQRGAEAARSVISLAAADIHPSAGSPMTHLIVASRLYFPFPQELVDPEWLKLRLGALPSTEQARHLLPVEA